MDAMGLGLSHTQGSLGLQLRGHGGPGSGTDISLQEACAGCSCIHCLAQEEAWIRLKERPSGFPFSVVLELR